jgi:hypothetical protein
MALTETSYTKGKKAGPGRPKGATGRVNRSLREALLVASETVGDKVWESGATKNRGVAGYLEFLAMADPKAFAGLLGRVIPLQIQAEVTMDAGLADRLQRARERAIAEGPVIEATIMEAAE